MATASSFRLSRLRAAAAGRPRALLAVELLAAAIAVGGVAVVLLTHPLMVDLEIPLRAAERWANGGEPYLASSFQAGPGYDLPFLYPPAVLPALAPIATLPRLPVQVAWAAILVGAAVFMLRRLGLPWRAVPLALCWVPFAEGLVGGNAQVLLVAGFVAVFFDRPAGAWRPVARDPASGAGISTAVRDGALAVLTPALKLSQPHAWVALLRRRPPAALLGLVGAAGLAAASLPLVGVGAWQAWVDQLGRAADPAWALRGSALVQLAPEPVATGLTLLSAVLVLFAPSRRLGAAAGLLLVLGAPSLRTYGVLFMLPAMLEIRAEVALVAVALVGLGAPQTLWLGILLVAVAFFAGSRLPWLAGAPMADADLPAGSASGTGGTAGTAASGPPG